jgi:hypothetical protein
MKRNDYLNEAQIYLQDEIVARAMAKKTRQTSIPSGQGQGQGVRPVRQDRRIGSKPRLSKGRVHKIKAR